MRLTIRRLDPTIPLPAYLTDEAAGFDLAAAHDVLVAPGQVVLVRTGAPDAHACAVGWRAGHFLGILARSGTPLKRGLVGTGRGATRPTAWA